MYKGRRQSNRERETYTVIAEFSIRATTGLLRVRNSSKAGSSKAKKDDGLEELHFDIDRIFCGLVWFVFKKRNLNVV